MKDVYITEQKTEMADCMNGTEMLNSKFHYIILFSYVGEKLL